MFFMYTCPGGTFALYSLICRHANVSLLPNKQVADQALSTYILDHPPERKSGSCRVRLLLETHKSLHTALLILVLFGTCMVIGDGLLTPAISGNSFCLALLPTSFATYIYVHLRHNGQTVCFTVFSAVSGLELSMSKAHHQCKFLSLFS